MIDRLWRVMYWIGFRLARIWWWLRHPDHRGALVAIWLDGRILFVRQSYRSALSWPGGGVNRGEDPRDAARRELAEELNLVVQPTDLIPVREMIIECDFRRDHVSIFELRLYSAPVFKIDGREIIEASFVEPRTLLAETKLSPVVRACLEGQVNPKSPASG